MHVSCKMRNFLKTPGRIKITNGKFISISRNSGGNAKLVIIFEFIFIFRNANEEMKLLLRELKCLLGIESEIENDPVCIK